MLKEKDARGLPLRDFTAEELVAATGPLPLTPREEEIERELNRHTGEKRIYLRSLQRIIRNADEASGLLSIILNLCEPRDPDEANYFTGLLSEVWNDTFRYELRGRTPKEIHGN